GVAAGPNEQARGMVALGIVEYERAADGHVANGRHPHFGIRPHLPPEELLPQQPELSRGEGEARQNDELDQVAAGDVFVFGPVDREILSPFRLQGERLSVGRYGDLIGVFLHHKSYSGSNIFSMKTSSVTSWLMVGALRAATTSMMLRGDSRGTIMFTFVVTVCIPNWKVLTGLELGRAASISSRVPNQSAPLGQTDAHIGFRPIEVRS